MLFFLHLSETDTGGRKISTHEVVSNKINTDENGSQPEVGLPRVTKETEGMRETCRTVAVVENGR